MSQIRWESTMGVPGVRPVGVPPGETPAAEGSIAETVPQGDYRTARGWSTAPMIVITVMVVMVAGFFLAYAITLMQ
ncbi:DUF6480 family protein [Streptomyces sp. NPDC048664]|uniref:DUF6480 family protein n=1 Tax=Streptomyces sp. NPDC048664 TaxID=3154505 RepID=UPI00343383D5